MSQDILGYHDGDMKNEAQDNISAAGFSDYGAEEPVGASDCGEVRNKLIINYLPQSLTDEAFTTLFSKCGQLLSCKIVKNHATGYSFGYGFVDYVDGVDAATAIQQLNGHRILNKTLKVAYARAKTEKGTNLYVTGLPHDCSDGRLQHLFKQYGDVIQTRILMDKSTGRGSGAGFVIYATKQDCDKCIAELNGTTPQGFPKQINVKYANTSGFNPHQNITAQNQVESTAGPMRNNGKFTKSVSRPSPIQRHETGLITDPGLAARNELGIILFIRNMPINTTEEALYLLFSKHGTIRKVNIMRDNKGEGRGFGFVTMLKDEEALTAVLKLNNSMFEERKIEVRFKLKDAGTQAAVPEEVPAAQSRMPMPMTSHYQPQSQPAPYQPQQVYIPSQDDRNLPYRRSMVRERMGPTEYDYTEGYQGASPYVPYQVGYNPPIRPQARSAPRHPGPIDYGHQSRVPGPAPPVRYPAARPGMRAVQHSVSAPRRHPDVHSHTHQYDSQPHYF